MSASIMFVGGATHPSHVRQDQQEEQHRMYQSVRDNLDTVLNFSARSSRPTARRNFRHELPISKIMLNSDIHQETLRQVQQQLLVKPNAAAQSHLLPGAQQLHYHTKEQVRQQIRDYFMNDPADHLILFLSGHGRQQFHGHMEESFLLPRSGNSQYDRYTDKELTADIKTALPQEKRLYLVIHSCHSGGMLNTWALDAKDHWVALFASAEADILARWSANADGFVQTFCEKARKNVPLNQIAQEVLFAMASVAEHVRPAFITTRPEVANHLFLA